MIQHISALNDAATRESTKVAALDLGSNSFHLVVARINAGSLQILHRVKQKVRLADGLDENNLLTEAAFDRGIDTLRAIAASLEGFEPDSVRIVATHTLRKAVNADEFIDEAFKVLPYPIEVIAGVEEARLIYNGVAHTNHVDGKQLVVDIGGGSTEFVIGEGFDPLICRSLQMGCVSYTKRFFPDGKLTEKAFNKAITAAEQELEHIEKRYQKMGWQASIGTSGTIRSLNGLCQSLQEGDNAGQGITLKGLKTVMKALIQAGHVDKLTHFDISESRQGVVAAGLAILIAILKDLNIERLDYSPSALREGVLYEMEETFSQKEIRTRTASSLATRYDVDTLQASLVLETTLHLFDAVAASWKLNQPELRDMLAWAALLHEVGIQINSRGVQRHSAYILENSDMPGFNQEQQLLLANLVRYHRKKPKLIDLPTFHQYKLSTVKKLIALLRLGVALNIKRQENFVPELQIKATNRTLSVMFPDGWLETRPIITADLERESNAWQLLDVELSVE